MRPARQSLSAVALCVLSGTAAAQTTEAITLQTPSGLLAGTLTLSTGDLARPLAIIIAGSGPTDRNGNTAGMPGGPDAYRLLADSLAAHGIASLRYDKRGIAGSRAIGIRESDLRFEMFADDAAGWVSQARTDRRFSTIVIVGHSEGSLLGMLAAQRSRPDAFVSLAGPARRADFVLHEQLAAQLPPALQLRSDSILASLVRGDTVANTPPELVALYRPSVQPYLISWFRYAGSVEIQKLTMPVLIVQGTHDVQVAPAEAELLAAASPRARVASIAGMNHVLKLTPPTLAEQMRFYVDPTVPLAPELVSALVAFIVGVPTPRR